MATKPKTVIKRVVVSLNFPKKIPDFIVYAKAIYKAMANNAYFTAFLAKITNLNNDIVQLDIAETACKTKPPTGSVDARNAALEVVKTDLRSLHSDVQNVADATPAKAEAIIISASMAVKKYNPHGKRQNSAKNGIEEGTVILIAEGTGPHEWRMSTDQTNWTSLPASITAKTTVNNLTSGMVYYFQNRQMLTKGEKTEWSAIVKIKAK